MGEAARPQQQQPEGEMQLTAQEIASYAVLLGIDRLDHTKGILERLLAVEELVELAERLEVGRVDARGQEKREQVQHCGRRAGRSQQQCASSCERRSEMPGV